MCEKIEEPCVVASEQGEVIMECGHAVVSLTPEVAHAVADDLHMHGRVAHQQRLGSGDALRSR